MEIQNLKSPKSWPCIMRAEVITVNRFKVAKIINNEFSTKSISNRFPNPDREPRNIRLNKKMKPNKERKEKKGLSIFISLQSSCLFIYFHYYFLISIVTCKT